MSLNIKLLFFLNFVTLIFYINIYNNRGIHINTLNFISFLLQFYCFSFKNFTFSLDY
jgi:hypothetical protein